MPACQPTRLVFFCLLFCLTGASGSFAAPIAATVGIPPQKHIVERIGGGEVVVVVMADKGSDPHAYEPTAAQMEKLGETELYIAAGAPFEAQWLPKFLALNPSLRVLSLFDDVARLPVAPDLALRDHNAHKGQAEAHESRMCGENPHMWLSPRIMAESIPKIVAALSERRPDKAAMFMQNGNALAKEIMELDRYIAALFVPIPKERRRFLSFHQNWTYYARNYDLHEVAIELGGREPSPKDMLKLMRFVEKAGIRVVVAGPMSSKSVVAAVSRDIKGVSVAADPLAENWSKALRLFSETLAQALAAE